MHLHSSLANDCAFSTKNCHHAPGVLSDGTSVGAIRFFFGTLASSNSDSLVSLFPSTLPLTELDRLTTPPMGVRGGVVIGRPEKELLVAATLGTFPRVGVGLLVTIPDCVATEEVEFDLVGLGGRKDGWVLGVVLRTGVNAGEFVETNPGGSCFSNGGAVAVTGVGVGVT